MLVLKSPDVHCDRVNDKGSLFLKNAFDKNRSIDFTILYRFVLQMLDALYTDKLPLLQITLHIKDIDLSGT